MKIYLIVAPLYCFTIILVFWDYTTTNCVWLMTMPIGAYIYFGKRGAINFSIYAVLIIAAVPFISNFVNSPTILMTNFNMKVSDMFLFASNILIAYHAIYYHDKIRNLTLISKIEIQEKIILPNEIDQKEIDKHKNIFMQIESLMVDGESFRDSNFNVSNISSNLNISASYISRAIRYHDYPNFNSYLNKHRIDYVLKRLEEEDLNKVTLMYIYTEAGYKNQSTFNNAFKSIMNKTPTKYIQEVKKQKFS